MIARIALIGLMAIVGPEKHERQTGFLLECEHITIIISPPTVKNRNAVREVADKLNEKICTLEIAKITRQEARGK